MYTAWHQSGTTRRLSTTVKFISASPAGYKTTCPIELCHGERGLLGESCVECVEDAKNVLWILNVKAMARDSLKGLVLRTNVRWGEGNTKEGKMRGATSSTH